MADTTVIMSAASPGEREARHLREDFAAKCREWLGTPFHHQGRLKGVGVDCVGLLSESALELGLIDAPVAADYSMSPDPAMALAEVEKHCERIAAAEAGIGDILHFRIEGSPQHFGVITRLLDDGTPVFLHAFNKAAIEAVVENRLDRFWRSRLAYAFRLREAK